MADQEFSIQMQGQDKTNQITDWKMNVDNNGQIRVTVRFPSGKPFTKPLEDCVIHPTNERKQGLISTKENIYHSFEKAVEYGNKYILVTYSEGTQKYLFKSANCRIAARSDLHNDEVFTYLKEVAHERVVHAKKSQDKIIAENVVRQLDHITPSAATVLQAYCKGENHSRRNTHPLIFPFGINESQFEAVKKAFSSQISIIEGPPGTGKTQTILNIVANILINKQSVAVVSNNNSAVDNVYEKLEKVSLDSLIARLGNSDNQSEFFKEIKPLAAFKSSDVTLEEISEKVEKISQSLQLQNEVARLTTEMNEVLVEKQYLEEWQEEYSAEIDTGKVKKYRLIPEKITDLIAYLNYLPEGKITFMDRIHLLLKFRMLRTSFLKQASEKENFILSLQAEYYEKMLADKKKRIKKNQTKLEKNSFQTEVQHLTELSLEYLKGQLTQIIPANEGTFTAENYKKYFNKFIKRFPIITSSTHSIINSIARGAILDYVIVDEASQQDIVPGILALGCARNIVIVGDRKQLPHIPVASKLAAPQAAYDCERKSLLDSFIEVFAGKVPITLLKEHYRCHPKIIQFCNQQFYDNQLVPMTKDKGEDAVELITTSKGNHMRDFSNLREIESLKKVGWTQEAGVGFIAPYNKQVDLAGKYLPQEIARATVHKFQGRECRQMIFSTIVDKKEGSQSAVDFVDQPCLVNVAVSRAEKKFTLVTGSDVFTGSGKNIAALIRYIRYYAPASSLHDRPVISAFDLLYSDFDKSLEKLNARLEKDPQLKSEAIVDRLLLDSLKLEKFRDLKKHRQLLLSQVVSTVHGTFTKREKEFMEHKSSCDFVLYYKVGKTPIGVIEVDGGSHFTKVQQERDRQKDSILAKVHIPILRLQTIEGEIEEKIDRFLTDCLSKES